MPTPHSLLGQEAASTPGPANSPTPAPATEFVSPVASRGGVDIGVDVSRPMGEDAVPYGVNGWWTDEDAELWRTRYAELDPQIVRLPLMHGALEPANDDNDSSHVRWAGFHFDRPIPWFGRSVTYRQWFGTLRDLDMTLMIYVPHLAGWLSANDDHGLSSTYPPRSLAEYGEFLAATLTYLVDVVHYPPDRIILEPINEPDLGCGQDGAVPCFWEDWRMEDLVAVIQTARDAIDTVDPDIRLVGLSTCCDHGLVEELMRHYDGAALLDGITYHRYERSVELEATVGLGRRLADWGLPVYIGEYGNTRYWSNGQEGALWHAVALAYFWPAGIAPIQFSMSELPGMHEGYNQLGLFSDWGDGWTLKPAYYVYAAFFRDLAITTPVSVSASMPLVAAAGRGDDGTVALWVINTGQEDRSDVVFRVMGGRGLAGKNGFRVTVYDIIPGDSATGTFVGSGRVPTFTWNVSARTVHVFVVEAISDSRER